MPTSRRSFLEDPVAGPGVAYGFNHVLDTSPGKKPPCRFIFIRKSHGNLPVMFENTTIIDISETGDTHHGRGTEAPTLILTGLHSKRHLAGRYIRLLYPAREAHKHSATDSQHRTTCTEIRSHTPVISIWKYRSKRCLRPVRLSDCCVDQRGDAAFSLAAFSLAEDSASVLMIQPLPLQDRGSCSA